MLAIAGIKIYLYNGLTESAIGAQDGVITLTEATVTGLSGNYLSNLLLEDWDSGCSSNIDIRTHPRPQTFSGGSVKIDNINDYWAKLEMYSVELEGCKIERVHYETTTPKVISTHYISDIDRQTDIISLQLSSIYDVQSVNITTPIQGDTYYPVIFGSHTYGLYLKDDIDDINPISPYESTFLLLQVNKLTDSDAELTVSPTDTSIPAANLNIAYESGYYFECIDGDGKGDILPLGDFNSSGYVMKNTTVGSKIGAIVQTANAIHWSAANDSDYSDMSTDGSGFDSNTSVFRLMKKDISYYSDQYSTFTATGSDVYDENKSKIAQSSYDKISSTITQEQINIIDDVIGEPYYTTFDSIEPNTDIDISISGDAQYDSMTHREAGIWTNSSYYTGYTDSGTVDNIIDGDPTTEYQININGGSSFGYMYSAYSVKIKGDFSDLESFLLYVENTLISSNALPYNNRFRIDAYWEDVNNYVVPTSPVELLYQTDNGATAAGNVSFLWGDYPSSFSTDNSNSNSNIYYDNTEITTGTYRNIYRGKDVYTVDSADTFYLKKQPTGILVTFYSGRAELTAYTVQFTLNSIMKYASNNNVSDRDYLLSNVSGRPYTTFTAVQNHIIKLRNWAISGVSQPSSGWGLEESSISITDNASNTTPTRAQFRDIAELNTGTIEERIQWESWNIIHYDKEDTPIINDVVSKLGIDTPEHSFTVPSDCKVDKINVYDDEDIFNTFTVNYNYDIATDTYLNSISISKVSQSSYSSDYVTGISSSVDSEKLWEDCNTLFNVTGRERQLPESRSNLRWIYTEADAIAYIENCLSFYGIKYLDSSPYGYFLRNYRIIAEHDISDYYNIEIGDSIGYTIPNVTEGGEYSGIVVGMKYIPDTKRCEISSIIRSKDIAGRTIIETGSADTSIIESGSQTDTIIEVGV